MRIGRSVSEDEMIARFLTGEMGSTRFGPAMRVALTADGEPPTTVTGPDLGSVRENAYGRGLLTALRGYGDRTELFTGFPRDVRWHEAELSISELIAIRYIDYSYWNELSGGSRLPADAAANIQRGIEVFGVSNSRFRQAAETLRTGGRFPPMIVAGVAVDELVVLEGHLRLTAYALAADHVRQTVMALVGLSSGMRSWACY